MNRTVAVVVGIATGAGAAGCGGKGRDDSLASIGAGRATGIGDCVDPTPASTRAWANEIDAKGRFAF